MTHTDRGDAAQHDAHGERITYNKGCRCQECRDAAARYERGRQWDLLRGQARSVPILGPRRRMQALVALGWDFQDQANHLGISNELVRCWATSRKFMYRTTAERIAAMYDALHMTLPPQETKNQRIKVSRARNIAKRKGWAPPLAWDNIDDPTERPKLGNNPKRRDDVDEVNVQRLLDGQRIQSTRAEKDEAMRRWREAGKSERALCLMHGWKDTRYGREETAA